MVFWQVKLAWSQSVELATSQPKLNTEAWEDCTQRGQEVGKQGEEGSHALLKEGMEQVREDWWFLSFSDSKQALLIGARSKYETAPDQCANWSVMVHASQPSTGKMGGRGRWISVTGRSLAGKPWKLGEVSCQGEILSQRKCKRCLFSFSFLALLKVSQQKAN